MALQQARSTLWSFTKAGPSPVYPLTWIARRAYSGTPTAPPPPAQPKKPSPYRLLQTHTFLSSFAPLHVAGWRLLPLPPSDALPTTTPRPSEPGMSDLQERRLVRVYEFERTREGWSSLTKCLGGLCDAAAQTNHHPSISVAPSSEYQQEGDLPELDGGTGYVISLSVHTHTPLPPVGHAAEAMRPGVTSKDLQFAAAAEEVFKSHSPG